VSRSPLAYPLNRSADMDVGGAADLQTDIMRFMAILSLCLVAIFALVQSIPLTPAEPAPPEPVEAPVAAATKPEPPAPDPATTTPATTAPAALEPATPLQVPPEKTAVVSNVVDQPPATVSLTRPKWVPKYQPAAKPAVESAPAAEIAVPAAEAIPQPEGFVLRFESDAALMRAVASSHVGVYALENDKAQRMTVSESRVSFWAASTPNTFHEMEAATVPGAVIDALARTGVNTDAVSWGVTLPGKLKMRLDALMQAHSGGSLIIGAGGDIRWEA